MSLALRRIGRHAHICPAAYCHSGLADQSQKPDLLIISNPNDLVDPAPTDLLLLIRHIEADKPVVLLSEEPYWDLLFSPNPCAQKITLPAAVLGQVEVHQINHCSSDLFAFEGLPYFPLTHPRFQARYKLAFARNAQHSEQDWATQNTEFLYGFVGTHRSAPWMGLQNGPLLGLCPLRTAHAESQSNALCLGEGWSEQLPLNDWHFHKLTALYRRCKVVNAIENTLAPHYITEKPYDAYAVGAVPLLYPRSDDAYARAGFEAGSYHLYGQESEIDWSAYRHTQRHLAKLWQSDLPTKERSRRSALLKALLEGCV